MAKSLIVATWNVSGFYLPASRRLSGHRQSADLDYFASELARIAPDIICVPETHLIKAGESGMSLTTQLAGKLGWGYAQEAAFHPSHIDPRYVLGLGLLSRRPPLAAHKVPLAQPDFPLIFPNGMPAMDHVRKLIVADFGDAVIVAAHNWPLEVFQRSYAEEPGAGYARYLEKAYLAAVPTDKPLILAGDLNFDSAQDVLPELVRNLGLRDALPQDQSTHAVGLHPDHILYSPHFTCVKAAIVRGPGDHFLCYAKLELDDFGA